MTSSKELSIRDHSRDVLGFKYVYAVVSRRAGGVSLGINLNPNKACNWACIYCQVDGLTKGGAPKIDLKLLENELDAMLEEILHGSFMRDRVPEDMQFFQDIAISGDGEPTTSPQFLEVIRVIGEAVKKHDLKGKIRVRLITNGSMILREEIQNGLRRIADMGGEVWIKVDSLIPETIQHINGTHSDPEKILQLVKASCNVCPTWIQTCLFKENGAFLDEVEFEAYEHFLTHLRLEKAQIEGVWLYSVARPSKQTGGENISEVPAAGLERLAKRLNSFGFPIRVV